MIYKLIVLKDDGKTEIAQKTGKFQVTTKGKKLPFTTTNNGIDMVDVSNGNQSVTKWFANLFYNFTSKGLLKTYTDGSNKGKELQFKMEVFLGKPSLLNWIKPASQNTVSQIDIESDL